jgi:hypothetical protein
VNGFTPRWSPPAAHQDACTQQNIDDFRKLCLGTGDATGCNDFLGTAAGKACAQCILTPPTLAALGPLIDHSSFVSLNTAGCVALATGDFSQSGCSANMLALSQCEAAACVGCEEPADVLVSGQVEQCESDADRGACRPYAEQAKCSDALADAGTSAEKACFAGATDFDTGYKAIVPMFCLSLADSGSGD